MKTTSQYWEENKRRARAAHRASLAKAKRDNDLRGQRERELQRMSDVAAMAREEAKLEAARPESEAQRDYWAAKTKETEFTNYMNRQEAKERGYALPEDKAEGGITGEGGEDYDSLQEWALDKDEFSRHTSARSKASQVMADPRELSYRQDIVPTSSRLMQPLNLLKKKTSELGRGAYDFFLRPYATAGKKAYDWLTEDIALP